MANEEHLKILKQGVEVWNKWRGENLEIFPDLREAYLTRIDLRGANLSGADLIRASLGAANLSLANLNIAILHEAFLVKANLFKANLRKARLMDVNLTEANLKKADLWEADLTRANFLRADLSGANLSGAKLFWTNLSEADLTRTDVQKSHMAQVSFGNNDLREVVGLESIYHTGPCYISIDTILVSQGKIPLEFLRRAGIPENFIEYIPSMISQSIQYYSCFISYSTKNQDFADRLHADLQDKGVRCWLASEDLKIGDRFRMRVDEAIRFHDKLMIVLSENSINSAWVEKEVETAFEKERKNNQTVLFPIRLDDAVMETDQAWAADIRRTRHIGDFTRWKDHDAYRKAFDRLLRDLKASLEDR